MIHYSSKCAVLSAFWSGLAALFLSAFSANAAAPAAPTFTHLFQTIPTTATNTAYTAGGTATHYLLYWTDNSTDEDFFDVEIKVGDVITWGHFSYAAKNATSAYYTPDLIAALGARLTQGMLVYYRVYACRGILSATGQVISVSERSVVSGERSIAFDSIAELGFTAPSSFSVTPIAGSDLQLRFSWIDNTDKEEEYEVYLKEASAASYPAAPAISFSFGNKIQDVSAGLTPGTSYKWKMRGRRATAYGVVSGQLQATGYEYGDYSNEATMTMPALIAPTGLTATAKNEKTVKLTWNDNSQNRTSYVVEYRTPPGSGTFTELGPTSPGTTVDVDWYPTLNTEWRIKAAYDSTPRKVSAESNAVPFQLPFGAPTNLQASITGVEESLAGTVTLTWVDNSSIETGFYVVRRPTTPANGQFSLIKTINTPNTTTTTVPATEDSGVSYDYQIITFYTTGSNTFETSPSNTAVAVTKDRITSTLMPMINPTNPGSSFPITLTSTTVSARTGFTATGLPAGLTLNSTTGTISGTPTEYGLFNVAVTATFANGFTDRKTWVLRLVRPPAAPTTPVLVTERTVGLASVTMPLTTTASDTAMFADRDTEAAVRVTTVAGSFDMILQPTLTPQTYANFMAYVDANDYNGSCFHRVSPDFVLQGGGYKPLVADGVSKYEEVTQRPSPLNEPGISNVVGTVSMARSSGVNSATHDFFVNLGASNPAILDTSNGGFTAFGRVAGNGISTTVAAINGKPGRNDYTISLRPSGSTTFTDIQPIVSSGLGAGTKWPLDDPTELATMDNTKAVTMTIARVPVLSFAVTGNTAPTKVSASIAGNNLQLTGMENGDSDVTVEATDLDNNKTSQTFTVHVIAGYVAPSITTQPTAQTVTQGANASLSVTAAGTDAVYQWKKNGQNITTGGNASTYTITGATLADVGNYSVLITNAAGFVLSNSVQLTVRVPVTINTQPLAKNLNYGQALNLSVAATGDPTITYQWRKGSTDITSATSPTYSISSLVMGDDADYSVVVANGVNTVTSDVVHVTVNPIDTDSDGLYNHEELALVPPTSVTIADTDGDGFSDGLEVAEGSTPTSITSVPANATSRFFALRDGVTTLGAMAFKRLLGASVPTRTTDVTVPDVWMGTYELTNREFASILQRARQDNLISITTESGRRVVRYPRTGGQIVCYLATPAALSLSDPPSCDIDADTTLQSSFSVPVTKQNAPASAITWHGAYLCTVVLNAVRDYAGKNVTATWSFNDAVDGFHLPSYSAWELAGRGISPTFAKPGLAYPTGSSVSASNAYFAQAFAVTSPKDVGKYAASRLGLFDLAGNVEEWVFNGVDATHAFTRGGSFADPATELINTADESLLLTTVSRQVGVRLALKAPAQATITTQPIAKFQRTDVPLTLSVVATGVPPLTYQWYKNNAVLAGKTGATLTIAAPVITDAGNYSVRVFSQGVNPVTSNVVPVALVEAKTTPPLISIAAGKGTSFQAKATGAPAIVGVGAAPAQTFTYRWKRPSGYIIADSNFATPNSSKLTMSTMLPSSSLVYTCEVSLVGSSLPAVNTSFELLVLQTPVVTGLSLNNLVVSGTVDVTVAYKTDGAEGATYRPSTFKITNLPPGLSYNSATGRITGKPTVSKPYNITVTASNAYGTSLPFTITVFVNPLDVRATGTFAGVIARNPSVTLNNNLGGRLDLTITADGKYTGSLNLAGVKYSWKHVLDAPDPTLLDHNPTSTFTITRANASSLKVFFKIDLAGQKLITSTVSEVPAAGGAATATADVTGWRKEWTKTVANGAAGFDTARINISLTPPSGGDVNLAPQGTGFATLTVDKATGVTNLSGKLPDGSAITGSAFISPTGEIMHYQLLNSNTTSLQGVMKELISARTISATTPLSWLKKPQTNAKDRIYKAGFDTTLTPAGGQYVAPTGLNIIGDLPPTTTSPFYPKNARLTFTSAFVAPTSISTLVQDFIISTANVVTLLPDFLSNPNSVTCKVDKATGAVSGTFTLSDNDPTSTAVTPPKITRSVSWSGLVIPTTPKTIVGYFTLPKLPNSAPNPHTKDNSEILSGKVTLGRVP